MRSPKALLQVLKKEKLILFLSISAALFAIMLCVLLVLLSNSAKVPREEQIDSENTETVTEARKFPPDSPKSLMFKSLGDGRCAVVGIGDFSGEELEIPEKSPYGEKVTAIGEGAFEGCEKLTSVHIPATVTKVGTGAFLRCSSLASITVSAESKSFGTVGGILYSKDKTRIICCPAARVGSYCLLDPNVKYVSDYAFFGIKNLRAIYYEESTSKFEEIKIGRGNEEFSSLPITCNYTPSK